MGIMRSNFGSIGRDGKEIVETRNFSEEQHNTNKTGEWNGFDVQVT